MANIYNRVRYTAFKAYDEIF